MNAIVFTKNDMEYEVLSNVLAEEAADIIVEHEQNDGHFHLEKSYDLAVVAIDGAQGMEVVLEYRERFKETFVIWITNGPYFAGIAIRTHIFDFILRPLTANRFREAVRNLMDRRIDAWQRVQV